jgi:multicomponent Na+:H+ antiporter subunit D
MTGETRMSRLGGLYRKMPWTFLLTLIGGLSISAFPLFSGFVSKSMITSAAFTQGWIPAGFLLTLASIGTFYCNGLKVPYFVWFGRDKCEPAVRERAEDPPWNMLAAMGAAAVLCIFLGCYTPALYNLLPHQAAASAFHPYTASHISESLQILLFTALGFFLLVKLGKIEPHAGTNVDLDWFYRVGGRGFLRFARKPVQALDNFVGEIYRVLGLIPLMFTSRFVGLFDQRGIDGVVDGVGNTVKNLGGRMRLAQRGSIQENLTIAFTVATVLFVVILFFS